MSYRVSRAMMLKTILPSLLRAVIIAHMLLLKLYSVHY